MASPQHIIIGLGNPGARYDKTRHNVGAWLVEALCAKYDLHLASNKKLNCTLAHLKQDGMDCVIAKPGVYMNDSGRAVSALCRYYKVPAHSVIIAHDELDFRPGQLRYKVNGGHGGHNGLKDIIQKLGAKAFQRLRIGIGHPGQASAVISYVLKPPSKADQQAINKAIRYCIDWIEYLISDQPDLQSKAIQALHLRN